LSSTIQVISRLRRPLASTVANVTVSDGESRQALSGSIAAIGRRFLPPVRTPRRRRWKASRGVNDPGAARAGWPRA
jgi:hypothetical protein